MTEPSSTATWKKPHFHQFDASSVPAAAATTNWTADAPASDDTLSAGNYLDAASSSDLIPDDMGVFYSSNEDGDNSFAPPPSPSSGQTVASSNAQASPYYDVPIASGGITINLEFVTADYPTADFEADVENAATQLAAAIHNQITLNLTVGYGEVNGETLVGGEAAAGPDLTDGQEAASRLANSGVVPTGPLLESYSAVRADLMLNAAPGDPNFNGLPGGTSIGGQSEVMVWTSQQKLFGQLPASGTEIDGGAGFAIGIPDSEMVGVALHELTHAMGRVDYAPEPDIMEFDRFSSPGVWKFNDDIFATASYFSLDGGNTKLADYGENSDPSDFANSNPLEGTPTSTLTPEDPFDQYYDSNTLQYLTPIDLTQLDVLGYNTFSATGPVVTTGNPSVTFTGGGSAVTLDNAVNLTDQESTTLASATVSIGAGFIGGDTLNFITQNGITGSYNSATGVLTLSGTANLANYQTALDSITYSFRPGNGDPTGGGSDTSSTIDWVVNDGVASSAVATSTLDTVHAPPTVVAGATAIYTGGGAAVTLDGAVTVSDPDSGGNLTRATVAIGAGFISGDTLNFTNQNGITGSYNSATGVLTLSGTASLANYQTALDSINYSLTPGNGDPTGGGAHSSRIIDWVVNDGMASSAVATSTLDTVHVAPTVVAGATATYTGAAVTLDGAVTVSDPDSGGNLTGATVSIGTGFLGGDTLNFTNQNGITGSYNSATAVLTLSGTASLANYQTALDSITYSFTPGNGDPTGGGTHLTRTIDWMVNDGTASSAVATSTLFDTAHAAPIVTAGATATFTGGGGAVTLDNAVNITDQESTTLASATVSIGTGFLSGDTLNFINQNGITGSYVSATGMLTLSGAASLANYQTALDSITYSFTPSNGDPTGGGSHTSRTIDWVVNDGTASSVAATSTLFTAHAPPAVTAGASVAFTGGGAAVTLDGTLTVSDPDSGGRLAGATVSIGTGFLSGDTFNFTAQNGITGGYVSATGVLTLAGTASLATYQTALDSITYSFTPSNGDPNGGGAHLSRTIDWAVNDGTASSATAISTLNTLHAAPTVAAGATAIYTGGGAAVTLDGALTVSDPDSGGNLTGATVSIGAGFLSGDTLKFSNQNGITGSYDSATAVLTLSGSASLANYQTALESITYSFTPSNGDPTGGGSHLSRTIDWVVNDGTANSAVATSTLDTADTGPTVTAGATVTFIGGGAAVTLDSAVTIADQGSTTLASAIVSIGTGFLSGDTLNFTNQNGITGSFNSITGVLTLSGTTSLANYQTALDAITYSFSPANGDPTGGGSHSSRTIVWVVNDGTASSNAATSTLGTVHVAPTVTAAAATAYTGGGAAATLDGALTVIDPDSGGNLTGATIAIGAGFIAGDTLNFIDQYNITGTYNASTGVLTLTGSATLANYQASLESISFSSTSGNPSASDTDLSRTVNWTVTDGVMSSNTIDTTVTVGALPPPPPPVGTTADMILCDGANGDYMILDIGNNSILAASSLGQVSPEWQVAGLGGFFGTDTSDMLLRDSTNGAFEIYDISNNTITSAALLGQVGLEWTVTGFGGFSSDANETDMLMRNSNTGAFEVYDISNNAVTSAAAIGQVGLAWIVAGFGDFSGNTNETDMLMRNGSTGAFEVYDIGHNAITAASAMGTVGLGWVVVSSGDFSGNANETDMLMRNSSTGAFEVYDICHNAVTSAASIGQVGLDWAVAGFGDFSGNANETDMLMRNSNTGAFEVYDICHNAVTSAVSIGEVGLDWTVAGFGDFSGNANETDMLMRNSSSGAFEVYDISHNAIIAAASLGQVGLAWQVGGIAAGSPVVSAVASTALFIQGMPSFDVSTAGTGAPGALLASADTPQHVVTIPH